MNGSLLVKLNVRCMIFEHQQSTVQAFFAMHFIFEISMVFVFIHFYLEFSKFNWNFCRYSKVLINYHRYF